MSASPHRRMPSLSICLSLSPSGNLSHARTHTYLTQCYLLISLRKSNPPQDRRLNILISNSKQKIDYFWGELTFENQLTNTFCEKNTGGQCLLVAQSLPLSAEFCHRDDRAVVRRPGGQVEGQGLGFRLWGAGFRV